jgi:hypothetical protein
MSGTEDIAGVGLLGMVCQNGYHCCFTRGLYRHILEGGLSHSLWRVLYSWVVLAHDRGEMNRGVYQLVIMCSELLHWNLLRFHMITGRHSLPLYRSFPSSSVGHVL